MKTPSTNKMLVSGNEEKVAVELLQKAESLKATHDIIAKSSKVFDDFLKVDKKKL
jgi:hypothetical protein